MKTKLSGEDRMSLRVHEFYPIELEKRAEWWRKTNSSSSKRSTKSILSMESLSFVTLVWMIKAGDLHASWFPN